MIPLWTGGSVCVDVNNWLAAAATVDCWLDEADGVTRNSCIWDMLNCSKLSGAGEGTFSKVPDVDRTSAGWERLVVACSCDVLGWTTDGGLSAGFCFDPPEYGNYRIIRTKMILKHQYDGKAASRKPYTHRVLANIFSTTVQFQYQQESLAIAKTTARCAQYMGALKNFESPD